MQDIELRSIGVADWIAANSVQECLPGTIIQVLEKGTSVATDLLAASLKDSIMGCLKNGYSGM